MTETELPSLASLREGQIALRGQLARLRRRLRLELLLEFLVDAAATITAVAALLVLLDWWFRFGLQVRMMVLGLSVVAILGFLAIRAIKRWRSAQLDDLALAMTLDRLRPGIGQQIADVLQLPDLLEASSLSTSPAMVRLAVSRATHALTGSDWHSLWNRKRTGLFAVMLLGCLLVPAAFGAIAPRSARLSLARWLLGSKERWPQRTYLTVLGLGKDGRIVAPKDERVILDVRSDLPQVKKVGSFWQIEGRGEPFALRFEPKSPRTPKAVQVREQTNDGKTLNGVMVSTGPTQFRYELPASPTGSSLDLTGGDDWLGPLRIERVDRPTLAEIKLRVKEPGSIAPEFREIPDPRQHLLFLPDTEVELTLVGSEPLAEARLKFHREGAPALTRVDSKTFTTRWILREATTLEIQLKAETTGLESRPAFLSIGILRDREPRVTLRALGVGSHVTPVATIPLSIAATDDFGLASIRLQVDKTTPIDDKGEEKEKEKVEAKTKRQTVALPFSVDKAHPTLDHQARHDVTLQTEPPKIGTLLRFVAEAEDFSSRGAQVGRSSALQLQVVSPDELFYEILIRQRAERSKFIALLEAMEKQTPVLATEPSAEDLIRVLRVEHSASRQLDQIAGRIADALQEMKLNQIGSPKSHRLLQDAVIEPIRALNSGPVNQLRNVLQSLTSGGSSPNANKETARLLHGEVVTKMKAILDQMSQWESFVDVVNQVAEVIRQQQKILQNTEKARDSRTQEIFDEKP
ncbi:hypothetical protein [Singulisphaera sp. PoT]|uniref:hypothetical protein n=1 Tax=Singulisphaera sp. PoT TaxID=3411797 RepID=UPI003BF60C10